MNQLKAHIRDIPDFPIAGVMFKDISPLLQNPLQLQHAVSAMIAPFSNQNITAIAAIEARGFIFGALAASVLNVSFIPLRKPGKLPAQTESVDYALEYGTASLEVHQDAIQAGDNVLIIDDVLATGGTAQAACQLISRLGGTVAGCSFLLEIAGLNGRQQLNDFAVHTAIDL